MISETIIRSTASPDSTCVFSVEPVPKMCFNNDWRRRGLRPGMGKFVPERSMCKLQADAMSSINHDQSLALTVLTVITHLTALARFSSDGAGGASAFRYLTGRSSGMYQVGSRMCNITNVHLLMPLQGAQKLLCRWQHLQDGCLAWRHF